MNECSTANGGCQQTCANEAGSFSCGCDAGYELDADGSSCNGKCVSLFVDLVSVLKEHKKQLNIYGTRAY